MVFQFQQIPNLIRFRDKVLIKYSEIFYILKRVLMRIIMGKTKRDGWFVENNYSWLNPITGKKLLIQNEQGFKFWMSANNCDPTVTSTKVESEVLSRFIPSSGQIVIDVGANVGKYTVYTASCVGKKGKIVSLEPFKQTFDLLRQNIQENGFEDVVESRCQAASNQNGKTKMFFVDNAWEANSIAITHGKNFVYVDTIKLDSLVNEMQVDHVDWIKIDVEGAEYEVLLGAMNILKTNNLKLIIEVQEMNKEKVIELLKSIGFSCTKIDSYDENLTTKQPFYNLFCFKK